MLSARTVRNALMMFDLGVNVFHGHLVPEHVGFEGSVKDDTSEWGERGHLKRAEKRRKSLFTNVL